MLNLFVSLAKSLEARFSAMDDRFSRLALVLPPMMIALGISAPNAPVAVRDEHPPARAPYMPYSEGLGKSCEGPATVSSPTGITCLPRLSFMDVIDRLGLGYMHPRWAMSRIPF